jgi:hypothetical protein
LRLRTAIRCADHVVAHREKEMRSLTGWRCERVGVVEHADVWDEDAARH